MNILILVLVSISFFILPSLARKWKNLPTLIAVCIAAAVNTNYYLSYNYPVYAGPFILGMDALIGMMYVYVLIIIRLDGSTKRAYDLTISAVAAIVLAGIIEMCAKTAHQGGFTFETVKPLLFNLQSGLSCLLAGFVAIFISDKLDKKNTYLNIAISCLAGSIVHSILFSLGFMITIPDILKQENIKTYFACFTGGLIERVLLIPLGLANYWFCKSVLKLKSEKNS